MPESLIEVLTDTLVEAVVAKWCRRYASAPETMPARPLDPGRIVAMCKLIELYVTPREVLDHA